LGGDALGVQVSLVETAAGTNANAHIDTRRPSNSRSLPAAAEHRAQADAPISVVLLCGQVAGAPLRSRVKIT
jgi:hypothetical protein